MREFSLPPLGWLAAIATSSVQAGLVTGDGKVVTVERPGGLVISIRSERMEQFWVGDCNTFRVETALGKTDKLVITGEGNLLPYLITKVAGERLEITLKEYIKPTKPIVVVAVISSPRGGIRPGPQTFGGFACMMRSTFDFSNQRK